MSTRLLLGWMPARIQSGNIKHQAKQLCCKVAVSVVTGVPSGTLMPARHRTSHTKRRSHSGTFGTVIGMTKNAKTSFWEQKKGNVLSRIGRNGHNIRRSNTCRNISIVSLTGVISCLSKEIESRRQLLLGRLVTFRQRTYGKVFSLQ